MAKKRIHEPSQITDELLEEVEREVGWSHGAWDTVDPKEILFHAARIVGKEVDCTCSLTDRERIFLQTFLTRLAADAVQLPVCACSLADVGKDQLTSWAAEHGLGLVCRSANGDSFALKSLIQTIRNTPLACDQCTARTFDMRAIFDAVEYAFLCEDCEVKFHG